MIKFNIVSFILFTLGFMIFWSNGSFDPSTKQFYVAICSGIFASVLSEFLMSNTIQKLFSVLSSRLGKTITFDYKIYKISSPSSHRKRWENVGGKLFLTDEKVIFKSHKFNIQNHEKEFDLSKIDKVENPNWKRLNFEYEGKLEKFIVEEPEKWVEKLKSP